jgi:hypothetical protein
VNPVVFISHSCKDNEQEPPPGLSPALAAERRERLDFARVFRDRLVTRLKAGQRNGERNLEVFLDQRDLRGGDLWRHGIHHKLRSCAGGVILLTPESIESKWVLKEATILSWRVFEDDNVIVVPVVQGVSLEDLARQGFEPLGLPEIQWVNVPDSPSEADLEQAIEMVVAALQRIPEGVLASDQTLTATERWIRRLADQLEQSARGSLEQDNIVRMFQAVDVAPEDRVTLSAEDDNKFFIALARQALVATGKQIVKMVNIVGSAEPDQREVLKATVETVWVDPAPAGRLLQAARTGQVVAIDATQTGTLSDYVYRAHCDEIEHHRVVLPTDVTDGTDIAAIAAVVEALADSWVIDHTGALAADAESDLPIFVLLGLGLVRPSVLDALTARYPSLTFVVAAGPEPHKKLDRWADRVVMLRPALQPSGEMTRSMYQTKLKLFVDGKARRP